MSVTQIDLDDDALAEAMRLSGAKSEPTHRYTRCGTADCRCHAHPPQPHGPYWQWTAKIDGKPVTRRLTDAEARPDQQWIDNAASSAS